MTGSDLTRLLPEAINDKLQGYLLPASNRKRAKAYYLKAWAKEKLSKEISFQSAFTAQELAVIAESEGKLKLALSCIREAARILQEVAPKNLHAGAVYDYQIQRLRKALR